jgi:hypothetical protein
MSKEQNIDAELRDAENKNAYRVKKLIERTENPNPLIIVIIGFVTLIIMFVLFIQFGKKSLSGIWVDDNRNMNKIIHNKWTDSIKINKKFDGSVKGNMVTVYMDDSAKIGLWIDNNIYWTNGSSWGLLQE